MAKILIIDDSPYKREELKTRVTALGHEPITAKNGILGLTKARDIRPAIILLDVKMDLPQGGGVEVLRRLKQDADLSEIPVIMVTAEDSSADSLVTCLEQGAVDYLQTPFSNDAIFNARVKASLQIYEQDKEKTKLRDDLETVVLELDRSEEQNEALLQAIFPVQKLGELQETGHIRPTRHENVAVLFCDVVGFTSFCDSHPPEEVIEPLEALFAEFETLAELPGLEKIQTVGDCFMIAGGLLVPDENPVLRCVECGLQMTALPDQLEQVPWQVRVGIHVGPLMAGKIGTKKFRYDLWGDTVNTAARVESAGEAGRVVVSEIAYRAIEPHVNATSLGIISLKGKPDMELFRIDGMRNN